MIVNRGFLWLRLVVSAACVHPYTLEAHPRTASTVSNSLCPLVPRINMAMASAAPFVISGLCYIASRLLETGDASRSSAIF